MATPGVRGQPFHELLSSAAASQNRQNHQAEIKTALDRVLSSGAFRTSKRAQDFLSYVVEHSDGDHAEYLKERTIGMALFGRNPDYDTGADAIVRVAANDVRKRLLLYYGGEGSDDLLVFHLPAGSYVPAIQVVPPQQPGATVLVPAELGKVLGKIEEHPAPKILAPLALGGWLTALVLGLLWTATSLWTKSDSARLINQLPWNGIFASGRTPEIILADGAMGALRTLHFFPLTFDDYADRSFLIPDPNLLPQLRGTWSNFTHKQLTSVADVRIAAGIAQLAGAAGRSVAVRYARDLQLVDFRRGNNLVLLGSHLSNPWVDLFNDQLHFQIETDSRTNEETIRVRDRKKGDPKSLASLVRSGSTGQAYAVLAYLKGLGDNGHVLIVQGTNMEGTDLAGALALGQSLSASELRECGLDPLQANAHFEFVLELNASAGGVRSSKVISRYCVASPA